MPGARRAPTLSRVHLPDALRNHALCHGFYFCQSFFTLLTLASSLVRRGAWAAQCPTSAQVMISLFLSVSPALGCALTMQSLLRILCLPLSLLLPCSLCLSLTLSLSKINKHVQKEFKNLKKKTALGLSVFITKQLPWMHVICT